MQTVIEVACSKGGSLREYIANDRSLNKYGLTVLTEKKPGRNPGWMKIKSSHSGRRGTINVEWSGSTQTLVCRIVGRSKGRGKPSQLLGEFLYYVFARFRGRLRHVLIFDR
jgi:hypothetical protein